MDLRSLLSVDAPEAEVQRRVAEFLAHAGYRSRGRPLQFKRGSLLGTVASFSPRSWPVTVSVQTEATGPEGSDVTAVFAVNTTGQWVTTKERAVWDAEVAGFTQSVVSGSVSIEGVKRAAAANRRNTLAAVAAFFAVSLVVGLLVAVGGIVLTERQEFGMIGVVAGVACGALVLRRYFGVGKNQ